MRWWWIITLFLFIISAIGCQTTPITSPDVSTPRPNSPDPYVRLGKLSTDLESRRSAEYLWKSGILYAAVVSAVVENKGESGHVAVIFQVENEEVDREIIYMEPGEEKEISVTLSLSEYRYTSAQQLKVVVSVIVVD